jgi:hypothetical protein
MNMAIKVSTTTVIDNALQMQNIATMDTVTQTTIIDFIKAVDHKLIIRDSAGNETFRIYGLPA